MSALLVLLALLWPLPCADAATCWLRWTPVPRATSYVVSLNGQPCATVTETRGRRGVSPPRVVLWPSPGRCNGTGLLTVSACNEYGCSPATVTVEWQAVPFRCFDAKGEVRCGS